MARSDASFTHAKQMSGSENSYSFFLSEHMASPSHLLVTVANNSPFFSPLLKPQLLKSFFTGHLLNNTFITSRDLSWRLSTMAVHGPSVGIDGLLCPDFLHQHYGERPPLTDTPRECLVPSALFSSLYPTSHSHFPIV